MYHPSDQNRLFLLLEYFSTPRMKKTNMRRLAKGTGQSEEDLGAKWGTEGKRMAQKGTQEQSIPGDPRVRSADH